MDRAECELIGAALRGTRAVGGVVSLGSPEQIGDVDEGIVEGSEEERDGESVGERQRMSRDATIRWVTRKTR